MKEAKIIIPKWNARHSKVPTMTHGIALNRLRRALVEAFGGYTKTEGEGAWVSNGAIISEPVDVYTVACTDSPVSVNTLRALAKDACAALEQECVYLKLPNGTVTFISS